MPANRTARVRTLERERLFLQNATESVERLAGDIARLSIQGREQLSSELRGLGERLRTANSRDLSGLDEELKLRTGPPPTVRDLRSAGEDLLRLGTTIGSLSGDAQSASAELAWMSLANDQSSPQSGTLYGLGVDLTTSGENLSDLARRILQLEEQERRFLRVLLTHRMKSTRRRLAPGRGLVERAPETREETWGGIESENLVRRKPRRGSRGDERPRGPRRVLRFDTEE